MSIAVYAKQKNGQLAAFRVPDGMSFGDVIAAAKQELGVDRALILAYDADQSKPKEAA